MLFFHELDHAIRKGIGKDGATKIYLEAIEGVDASVREKILQKYKKTAKPGEAATVMDETNAYYAEQVLSNRNTLEKLIEAEPTLKDKILSFFKGASSDYADVPKLSGAAKRYYRTYKKLFDEFSERNAQSNALEPNNSVFGSYNIVAGVSDNVRTTDDNKSENAHLSTLFEKNSQKTPLTNINQGNVHVSDRQYALSQAFTKELQDWFDTTSEEERAKSGNRFLVGTTSTVLKNIGVREGNIYFGGSKINKILKNNDSMTLDIIKQAVNLIEDPILVMKSKTVEDSLVLFGEVYTAGGKPVMLSLLYNPKNGNGEILDYSVITSAYGRKINNLQNLINTSKIYYVNEQKNRTDTWLKALGLQLPSALTKLGSIDSIPQTKPKSNSSDEIYLENSSDKQFALDIDSEGEISEDGRISGAEVMGWLNKKSESDGKLDLEKTVARGLPYKSGKSSLTVGEIKKLVANSTREKVYSKADALKVVNRMSGTWGLTQRARDEIADTIWQFLNEAPDVEYRQDMAHDIAEYIVAKVLVDSKTENPDAIEAAEKLSYLRTGIGKLSFFDEIKKRSPT